MDSYGNYNNWKVSLILLMFIGSGCSMFDTNDPLFTKLSARQTGITFENTITETDSLSFREFPFIFNGGGVAIGDINNDGLQDIYLTGNMVSSKLYLNKGDFQFTDITESSGTETNRWATGASFVDINSDGFIDLYVSVMGPEKSETADRANQLFINNGDNTFTEAAARYGIDFTGYTTHAAFFDYDGDEYLDLFLLNNSPVTFGRARDVYVPPEKLPSDSLGFDKLFKNNRDGTFTDVSKEAGIERITGFGLGVAVSDFNMDGWPDIYVSNDISANDVLYMNNKDGTFSNKRGEYVKQTSYAGMGMDAADFNNDSWPDIIQTDMMPEEIAKRKQISGAFTFERFQFLRKLGYHYYYSKNSLQLNRGVDSEGNLQFSEIARMAGVAYTDWSWAALFADLDNSGSKDIMITNGYPKAVNNFDYLMQVARAGQFGTEETAKSKIDEHYRDLQGIEIPNYLFKNTGSLQFKNMSEDWGFRDPGFSYGAATADLNNDGALDIVINNINASASVYKNSASEQEENNYLKLELKGEDPNRQGLGTQISLYAGDETQYHYHTTYRGYQSTVDGRVHFGLADSNQADSLLIVWPDKSRQLLKNVAANQIIKIRQQDAKPAKPQPKSNDPIFEPVEAEQIIDYKYPQTSFNDFVSQPFLPYMLTRSGPPIAVADINGDGLDDIFIGGPQNEAGSLFIQSADGQFQTAGENRFLENDAEYHDTAALFFDVNGDGLKDLYVASGGYQVSPASDLLQDRIYINRGKARFSKQTTALPRMLSNTSVVKKTDFTGDGWPDLFVGGGTLPGNYPFPDQSYLLVNKQGTFEDQTNTLVPELSEIGIVNDAEWADFDRNGTMDLITAGEWMPLQLFRNEDGHLKNRTEEIGLDSTTGWWFSIGVSDFNGDGYPDIVAGNIGENHTFSALSKRTQVGMFAGNFNRDQQTELIFTYEGSDGRYPFFGLARLGNQISALTDEFPNFRSFASVPMERIFSDEQLQNARHYEPDTFSSTYYQNNGDGTFSGTELSELAQISSVHALLAKDFDRDGNLDLLLAGNMYHTEPNIPRLDAGKGLFLKGDGSGQFNAIPMMKSGFIAPNDAKRMVHVKTKEGRLIAVVNSNGKLQFFKNKIVE